MCPPTWDGWQCWEEEGEEGRAEERQCPTYIYFYKKDGDLKHKQ